MQLHYGLPGSGGVYYEGGGDVTLPLFLTAEVVGQLGGGGSSKVKEEEQHEHEEMEVIGDDIFATLLSLVHPHPSNPSGKKTRKKWSGKNSTTTRKKKR
jgi:hypothetical protein